MNTMNDENTLENHLRGWKPRRPNAELRRRLFPELSLANRASLGPGFTHLWAWLTPATVAVMVLLLTVDQRAPAFLDLSGSRAGAHLAAAAFSNQFYAAYANAGQHSQYNASPDTRLGWTNGGVLPVSIRFSPHTGTNLSRW